MVNGRTQGMNSNLGLGSKNYRITIRLLRDIADDLQSRQQCNYPITSYRGNECVCSVWLLKKAVSSDKCPKMKAQNVNRL